MTREKRLNGMFESIKEYSVRAKEQFDSNDIESAISFIKLVEKEIKELHTRVEF